MSNILLTCLCYMEGRGRLGLDDWGYHSEAPTFWEGVIGVIIGLIVLCIIFYLQDHTGNSNRNK